MDYCEVSISCLDSHSDGTHSLQRIHWWASDVMLFFSHMFWWRKNLRYILNGMREHFQQMVIFRWTITLILLFHKNALNWSNVTVKTFTLLQKSLFQINAVLLKFSILVLCFSCPFHPSRHNPSHPFSLFCHFFSLSFMALSCSCIFHTDMHINPKTVG